MPKPLARVDEIDWRTWSPVDRATLLFVSHDASLERGFDRTLALAEINCAEPPT